MIDSCSFGDVGLAILYTSTDVIWCMLHNSTPLHYSSVMISIRNKTCQMINSIIKGKVSSTKRSNFPPRIDMG